MFRIKTYLGASAVLQNLQIGFGNIKPTAFNTYKKFLYIIRHTSGLKYEFAKRIQKRETLINFQRKKINNLILGKNSC